MKIFALDSSSTSAGVAISEDEHILGEFFIDTKLTHSQTLMTMTEALYKNTSISPEETDLFACCTGPGSFTGVRIGVCAVKGMASALNKPCVGVSALEAMAYGLTMIDGIVCAVMDARREQVYNAIFEVNNGVVTRLCEDRAISCKELLSELCEKYSKKNIFLVGNGEKLCYTVWGDTSLNLRTTPANVKLCRASGIILAVLANKNIEEAVNADLLNPTYLRMPQAQRNLNKGKLAN